MSLNSLKLSFSFPVWSNLLLLCPSCPLAVRPPRHHVAELLEVELLVPRLVESLECHLNLVLVKILADIFELMFGDISVPILIHQLKQPLCPSLFSHKLLKR